MRESNHLHRDLTDLARARASQFTSIPVANIVITATHTHGGPEYLGPLREFLHERAMKKHGGRDPHEPIDYARCSSSAGPASSPPRGRTASPRRSNVIATCR